MKFKIFLFLLSTLILTENALAEAVKPHISGLELQCLDVNGKFKKFDSNLDPYQCSPYETVVIAKIGGSGNLKTVHMSATSEHDAVKDSYNDAYAPRYVVFPIDLCRVGFNVPVTIKVYADEHNSSKKITITPFCGD